MRLHFCSLHTANAFSRLIRTLQQQGLGSTLIKLYMLLADSWFDIRYRTDTSGLIPLERLTLKSPKKYGRYQPVKVVPLKRLLAQIKPLIPSDSVFVDFGCGKGRALLIASEFGFTETRGVEYAHELCGIAIENCARYKSATNVKTAFRIIESDAGDYIINPDENCFFLFNPFGKTILTKVLRNIKRSLEIQPRSALLIYDTPRFDQIILQLTNFAKIAELKMLGYDFIVYSNTSREFTGHQSRGRKSVSS